MYITLEISGQNGYFDHRAGPVMHMHNMVPNHQILLTHESQITSKWIFNGGDGLDKAMQGAMSHVTYNHLVHSEGSMDGASFTIS